MKEGETPETIEEFREAAAKKFNTDHPLSLKLLQKANQMVKEEVRLHGYTYKNKRDYDLRKRKYYVAYKGY